MTSVHGIVFDAEDEVVVGESADGHIVSRRVRILSQTSLVL